MYAIILNLGPVALRTENILVVDDETSLLELMVLSLARHARRVGRKWQICRAGDAATAMQMARDMSCGLNVLITDIHMPGISGDELIRQIRKSCPHIDVLAITGGLPEGSLGLANIPFLTKPFDMASLAESVQDILAAQLR